LKHYEGCMRPRMHNFFDPFDVSQLDNANLPNYTELSLKIANKINEVRQLYPQLTMVWVNGDHLMMVPHYVRAKFEKANIAFYFHSAFPASAIFATFPNRNELIHSLLCCDIIGFHLFEYARNFLNTCHRLYGAHYQFGEGGAMAVIWQGRSIQVSVKHIGIDEDFITMMRSTHDYRVSEKRFKEEFKVIAKMAQRNQFSQQPLPSTLANSRSQAIFNYAFNSSANEDEIRSRSVSTSNSSVDLQKLQAGISPSSRKPNETSGQPIIIASIDSFHPMAGIK
jgi:trehalose-6-phosphate synthase